MIKDLRGGYDRCFNVVDEVQSVAKNGCKYYIMLANILAFDRNLCNGSLSRKTSSLFLSLIATAGGLCSLSQVFSFYSTGNYFEKKFVAGGIVRVFPAPPPTF